MVEKTTEQKKEVTPDYKVLRVVNTTWEASPMINMNTMKKHEQKQEDITKTKSPILVMEDDEPVLTREQTTKFNTPAESIIQMLKEIQSGWVDDSVPGKDMKKRIIRSINALYDKKNLFKIDEYVQI